MADNTIIHIVDDEPAVRQSLAFLVAAAGYAVRVHDSPAAFLEARPYPTGHCLITDLQMPGMNGVGLLEAIKAAGDYIPSIVVTGHGDVAMAVAAMKVGAIDFIEKPFDTAVLLDAIRRAVGQAKDARDQRREQEMIGDRLAGLSDRERAVFEGVVAGKANKTVARELELSPRTVEVYRANVMAKMQAHTLSELVRMALMAGVNIPDPRKG